MGLIFEKTDYKFWKIDVYMILEDTRLCRAVYEKQEYNILKAI